MKAIRTYTFALTILFCQGYNVQAQNMTEEIRIGDKMPDILMQSIINQKKNTVSLRELHENKLLIIDFWATWCKPCLQEINFLDSLKRMNPKKFSVLMVTSESKKKIESFLSKKSNRDINTSNLILATNDTLIRKIFPHREVPHNIWIDSLGIVRAITSGSSVTTHNILNFNTIDADQLKLKSDRMDFDAAKEFHIGDTSFTYRSIITPFIPGAGGSYGGGKNPRRFAHYNGSITHLFWNAFSNHKQWRSYLIEVHTQDSLRLFNPVGRYKSLLKNSKYQSFDDWLEDNTYCYALTLPKGVHDTTFRNYMFSDLERQFQIRASIEKREITCTVVTKSGTNPATTGAKKSIKFIDTYKLSISNASITDVLDWWWTMNDEKNHPYPFSLEIPEYEIRNFDAVLDFSREPGIGDLGITFEMFCNALAGNGFAFKNQLKFHPKLVLRDL